jgi:hypothetical protein
VIRLGTKQRPVSVIDPVVLPAVPVEPLCESPKRVSILDYVGPGCGTNRLGLVRVHSDAEGLFAHRPSTGRVAWGGRRSTGGLKSGGTPNKGSRGFINSGIPTVTSVAAAPVPEKPPRKPGIKRPAGSTSSAKAHRRNGINNCARRNLIEDDPFVFNREPPLWNLDRCGPWQTNDVDDSPLAKVCRYAGNPGRRDPGCAQRLAPQAWRCKKRRNECVVPSRR